MLEVACAQLFQQQVPKFYWSNTILIAAYLINRMLSTILAGQIPHTILLLGVHCIPHVFGCTSCVHALDLDRKKLDPCSVKCVFLRYSHTQKAFKCYSPLCRQLVCDDVTYNKSLAFFPVSSSADPSHHTQGDSIPASALVLPLKVCSSA